MCGGLVVLSGSQKSAPIVGQLQYHIGRGISYVLSGVLASYFGESLISYFSNDSLKYLAPLSIVAVLLVAYTIKVRVPSAESYYAIGGSQKSGIITKLFTLSAKLPFALGLLAVFLPCGWLYSFVLLAAGSGSEVSGAKVMLAFWLGTLPALLAAGTVFEGTVRALSKKYSLLPLILVVMAATISVTLRITPSTHNHGGEIISGGDEMVLPEKCLH
jgi:sulfite exporter TauE/SafE